MLRTKFQAPEQSGSEEENFKIFLYVFFLVQTQDPGGRATLDPATFI